MLTAVHERPEDPRPELNTTPLIDVMLVLLTMLMLTLPVMTHSVRLDLGTGSKQRAEPPPVALIEIDFDGSVYWNNEPVPLAALAGRTQSIHAKSEKAEFHVRPARLVRFEYVAKALALIQRNGARSIMFLGNERYL